MVFIKAKVGPALIGHPKGEFTVHYFDEQGNLTIRSKGKRTWRCNNPGNLKVGGNRTSSARQITCYTCASHG